MRLLFIKPKHIGDSLVLTPTIAGARQMYPNAEIWVIVRQGCEGILRGCPQIDRILVTAPVDSKNRAGWNWRSDGKMLRELRSVRFDHAFELGDGHRGGWFALACRRERAWSVKPATPLNWVRRLCLDGTSTFEWQDCHRVEKDYCSVAEFLPLPKRIPPMIFDRACTREWEPASGFHSFGVMQIGTRQKWNRWDRHNWLSVGRFLLHHMERLVITCGPDKREVADADWLLDKLGPSAVSPRGTASWAELADLLYRAEILVGPNTATMHLAAACQCPTVALFGPTRETHWRPWQSVSRIVTSDAATNSADTETLATRRTMKDIALPDVFAACEDLLAGVSHAYQMRS